jgi:tRNA A-37 threonylcarbamoyl transferase component Bud32
MIPIANFKSNKLSQIDKKQRAEEFERLKANPNPSASVEDAIRLPNTKAAGAGASDTASISSQSEQSISSPTSYLSGGRIESFFTADDKNSVQIEGEMIRKATETKLKKYWYCLLGKELYVYKNRQEDKHKGMHNLIGVFIKEEPEEKLDDSTILYPFSLVFPPAKARTYYLQSKEERDRWIRAIKKVIGYSSLHDFYEIKEALGKGKFGLVKAAIHKKTGKKVAVKIMSKKEMTVPDIELQRREIEILKMCQHPYIIRLLDIFENEDHIYIVMENLSGGDLFTYLEKRKFTISEQRAQILGHQIATALFYLHSYGICHRDLKPENILMVDASEESDLKIVDFGLSKIIGPQETSLDPFGTLVRLADPILYTSYLNSRMWHLRFCSRSLTERRSICGASASSSTCF